MKLNIYTIFDTASGLYLRPLFAQSDGLAIRSFEDAALNAESEVGQHPEDYSLNRIGIFDDTNGTLTNEINACLTTGLEAVAKARNIDKTKIATLNKQIEPTLVDEPIGIYSDLK